MDAQSRSGDDDDGDESEREIKERRGSRSRSERAKMRIFRWKMDRCESSRRQRVSVVAIFQQL